MKKNSDYWDEDDREIKLIDLRDTKGDHIERLSDGILIAIINCAYYDYSTETYVKGPVEFRYERTSYSVI